MANFNEHALEMSIMELFKDEGYIHLNGSQIHRERTEVLLQEDLKQYLYNRYAKDGITPGEEDGILLMLRNIPVICMKQTRKRETCLSLYIRGNYERYYI